MPRPWYGAGVTEFPDMAALQEFERMGIQDNKALYIETDVILGTKWEEAA